MQEQNVVFFLIASTTALMLISIGFLVFVTYFFRSKKNTLIKEQQAKLRYEQNLSSTKTEVQANTLSYISRELHDNVGQLLTIAKRYTSSLQKQIGGEQFQELDQLLVQTATEVRHISHSLQEQGSANFALIDALQKDIARIEKIGLISFSTNLSSYTHTLSSDQELILFRIIQEFIANSLKHSEASQLTISITPQPQALHIQLADNGIGYNTQAISHEGNGLANMQERALMLGATLDIQSAPDAGTQLHIYIPLINPQHA